MEAIKQTDPGGRRAPCTHTHTHTPTATQRGRGGHRTYLWQGARDRRGPRGVAQGGGVVSFSVFFFPAGRAAAATNPHDGFRPRAYHARTDAGTVKTGGLDAGEREGGGLGSDSGRSLDDAGTMDFGGTNKRARDARGAESNSSGGKGGREEGGKEGRGSLDDTVLCSDNKVGGGPARAVSSVRSRTSQQRGDAFRGQTDPYGTRRGPKPVGGRPETPSAFQWHRRPWRAPAGGWSSLCWPRNSTRTRHVCTET